jgi:CRISPR-associated exonuclease Cas4
MSVTFSDLRVAAYCPRKLYYRRREPDRSPPNIVARRRALADRYEELLDRPTEQLSGLPIGPEPEEFRRTLRTTRSSCPAWEAVVDPIERNVALSGRECHGIVHKVLEEPLRPSVVSPGSPPETGVWEPHSVQAVAAAKALAWERGTPIEQAVVEYPAYGVIREVSLTTRRKAAFRSVLEDVRSLDGPPARIGNRDKCSSCEFSDMCGVRTRTLGSLLGL